MAKRGGPMTVCFLGADVPFHLPTARRKPGETAEFSPSEESQTRAGKPLENPSRTPNEAWPALLLAGRGGGASIDGARPSARCL